MQAFFKITEGQQPNPEWDEKLTGLSGRFRELKDRAVSRGQSPAPRHTP